MKKQFIILAALAIAMAGCKTEQSELSLENIKDVATVSGHVTYSQGQQADGDNYATEILVPAAGKTVYVDIPYSSYKAGASGTKTYSAVVDSAGNYTLSIPVPTIGVAGAELRFEEFTAEQSLYQRMEKDKPLFETRMCRFLVENAPALPSPLKPEAFHVEDLCYAREIIDMKDYKETATVTGSLLLPYETGFRTGAYKAAADCQFEITIADGEDIAESGAADAPQFTYGTTTNDKGEFTINLPIKNLKKGFAVKQVKVVPKADAQFTHYTNLAGTTEKLAGVYQMREDLSLFSVSEVTAGVACNIGERPLKFVPGYNNGISTPVAPATWENNLAGWVFGEERFRNLTASATISGSIALAQETSFGTGTYAASAQTVTLNASYPFTQLVVLTKADGTFQLTIPAAEDGINPAGEWNVTLNQPNNITFTHYASASKQLVLKAGRYNLYEKVRAADAAWNELGKFYFRFVPSNAPETWCTNLAGWVIKPGYEETATVKAKLQFPVETGYCAGKYQGASLRAALDVNYDGGTTTFVGPVAADGTFQVTIPVKSVNSTMNADNIYLFDNQTDNFKHYLPSSTQIIEGTYTVHSRRETENAPWNNKWTIYYQFAPSSAATDYTADLLGWMIVPEGWTTEQWSSTVMMPTETGFWKGSYEPLARKKVQVSYTMNGTTYRPVVLTDANGVVTCPIYMKYGIETPNISVKIFEDKMVHYYNPQNSGATTTLPGTYALLLRTPEVAAWNAERTYYMTFSPATSVDKTLLSWTSNIAEWIVLSDRKDVANIKLYAQKAIETTTSNNHEASWANADKVKATITVYDPVTSTSTTVKRQVAGRNIAFSLPLSHPIEPGTTSLRFTITLESETGNITSFNHYPNPSENNMTTLYGNYRNADNVSNKLVVSENKVFELKESAKMMFYERNAYSTPSGYIWNLSDEI